MTDRTSGAVLEPIWVLVRPEIPENLGFIARTLACYGCGAAGLGEAVHEDRQTSRGCLRLVGEASSLDALLHPQSPAWRTVSGGEEVLRAARVYASLGEAVADCHTTWGFSRRPHRDARSAILEAALDDQLHPSARSGLDGPGADGSADSAKPHGHRLALIFGPESQGLSAEDGHWVQLWVRLASVHPTLSLNLSHAVAIVAHTVHRAVSQVAPGAEYFQNIATQRTLENDAEGLAPLGLLERGWELLARALRDFEVYPEAKAEAQIAHLRGLWQRMRLSRGEAEFLMGTLKVLVQGRRARRQGRTEEGSF